MIKLSNIFRTVAQETVESPIRVPMSNEHARKIAAKIGDEAREYALKSKPPTDGFERLVEVVKPKKNKGLIGTILDKAVSVFKRIWSFIKKIFTGKSENIVSPAAEKPYVLSDRSKALFESFKTRAQDLHEVVE